MTNEEIQVFLAKLALMRVTNDTHRCWFASKMHGLAFGDQVKITHCLPTRWHWYWSHIHDIKPEIFFQTTEFNRHEPN